MKTTYRLGYYDETNQGPVWKTLWTGKLGTDAEAEAEVDGYSRIIPTDLDGTPRHGVYIKRGKVEWFRRFSCHAGK